MSQEPSSILYIRIKLLCSEQNITLSKLEKSLDFGTGTIKKWKSTVSPSVDKIKKLAEFFNVSADYLLGLTSTRENADTVLDDKDVITFQRAKERLSPMDKSKARDIFKAAYPYAFQDGDDSIDD